MTLHPTENASCVQQTDCAERLCALTFGPNTTPPPGFSGVVLEPCLALPLPFCAKGFRPPPLTSALVLVLAVPCKAAYEESHTCCAQLLVVCL